MQKLAYTLMISVFILPLSAQKETSLYQKGQELYRDDLDAQARTAFETFRFEHPESRKADDALWYLGRIYRKLGLYELALQSFRAVLEDAGSNRKTEALYDAVRLLDTLDREEEAVGIANPILLSNFVLNAEGSKACNRWGTKRNNKIEGRS